MNHDQTSLESEATPRIGSVLETAFVSSKTLIESVAFYQRVLGFTLASEPMSPMCALSIPANQVLLLFKKGGSVEATVHPYGTIPPTDGDGFLHVAFFIPASHFEIWQDRLRRSGVDIESLVTWPEGGRSIYFRDPDSHVIELKTSNWHGRELHSGFERSGV